MLTKSALKTIAYLTDQNLLTDKDALTVALIEELCKEWTNANSATQRAALSKELRNCMAALPVTPATSTGVDDILKGITDA